MNKKPLIVGAGVVAVLVILCVRQPALETTEAGQSKKMTVQAPKFEVDPMWPKPLPNHWILQPAMEESMRRPFRNACVSCVVAVACLAGSAAAKTPAAPAVPAPTYVTIPLEITVDRPAAEVWKRV